MRWRSFRKELLQNVPSSIASKGIYDTLTYVDSGYVAGYELNNDYVTQENSTLRFVGTTTTKSGDIIAIIDNGQELASGVVVTVDSKTRNITFNTLLKLFDVECLDIYRAVETKPATDDTDAEYFEAPVIQPVEELINQIKLNFTGKDIDRRRRLPLQIVKGSPTTVKGVWEQDNSFNMNRLMLKFFDSYNIVCQTSLVFEPNLNYIRLRIFVNNTNIDVIKLATNVKGLQITHNEVAEPKTTVIQFIDKETKHLIYFDQNRTKLAIYYLNQDGSITRDKNSANRFELYKFEVVEFDSTLDKETGQTKITLDEVAEKELAYGEFNHIIKITARKNNGLISNLTIGDRVKIVYRTFEQDTDTPEPDDQETRDKYITTSIYTGRQESSDSNIVTLIFGKIRVNYTEIIADLINNKRR